MKNESTDPFRPVFPDFPSGERARPLSSKGRNTRRNIAALVVVGIVFLVAIFFVGREREVPADEAAPLPTSVQ